MKKHPASESAESDGVRLIQELEGLKKKLSDLEASDREAELPLRKNAEERESLRDTCKGIQAHNQRQRRVLQVELANVQELLRPLTNPVVTNTELLRNFVTTNCPNLICVDRGDNSAIG